MFQQSILDSLQNMGFGGLGWNQLSGLSPDQISNVFQSCRAVQISKIHPY